MGEVVSGNCQLTSCIWSAEKLMDIVLSFDRKFLIRSNYIDSHCKKEQRLLIESYRGL